MSIAFSTDIEPFALPDKQGFAGQVDSLFRASLDEGPMVEMSLVKLTEIVCSDVQENFSLLFRSPIDIPPEQGIYRMEHESLGPMDIFLVPVKLDETGLYFEAVFNNLKH